jgi:hypothetical protein
MLWVPDPAGIRPKESTQAFAPGINPIRLTFDPGLLEPDIMKRQWSSRPIRPEDWSLAPSCLLNESCRTYKAFVTTPMMAPQNIATHIVDSSYDLEEFHVQDGPGRSIQKLGD